MERSLDVKLAAHQAAAERRRKGLNPWAKTIKLGDIWRDEALTFEQRRDAIVARIRESGWPDENDLVRRGLEDLEDFADTPDEFDDMWSEICDRADLDRVWIDTREGP